MICSHSCRRRSGPLIVFVVIVAGTLGVLSMISNRNSQAEERLERIGRPKSLAEIELAQAESQDRFSGLKDTFQPRRR